MTRGQGKCVLVTTHDMHVAQEICDRIGIINKGHMVACKPTEELLELFSDQIFEFRLDRLPTPEEVAEIPGIRSVEMRMEEDAPLLAVWVDADIETRSSALYATIERLKQRGFLLRSVSQRQQTLESVFLRLTGSRAERIANSE